jgi:hypothetical protein
MRRRDRETGGAWRPAAARLVIVGIFASAMTGCVRWPGPYLATGHLKDNPFDQTISSGSWATAAKGARQRLLALYPIGSSSDELRRYLKSIGASCDRTPGASVVCQYSQYGFIGTRGIIGDDRRTYAYFDFTVRIRPNEGPIGNLTVCNTYTKEVEPDPTLFAGRHNRLRKSKFKPCV